jgi:hypothetical protein
MYSSSPGTDINGMAHGLWGMAYGASDYELLRSGDDA